MRVAVPMINLDAVADVGAIQIRRWRRKAVVGIGGVAIALGWRCRFVVGGAVTGGALAMTRVIMAPGRTSPPACLDCEMTVPAAEPLVVL
jgi:hypothetical protein